MGKGSENEQVKLNWNDVLKPAEERKGVDEDHEVYFQCVMAEMEIKT